MKFNRLTIHGRCLKQSETIHDFMIEAKLPPSNQAAGCIHHEYVSYSLNDVNFELSCGTLRLALFSLLQLPAGYIHVKQVRVMALRINLPQTAQMHIFAFAPVFLFAFLQECEYIVFFALDLVYTFCCGNL